MSFRIVPAASHPTSNSSALYTGAPSAPGVHDTLRANLGLVAPAPASFQSKQSSTSSTSSANVNSASSTSSSTLTDVPRSSHPLERRLAQWRATQDSLKMNMLGQQFGIAEPVRRGMELLVAQEGEWQPAAVVAGASGIGGHTSLAGDILSGRDAEIGWEDVFGGGNVFREGPDFHTEMEARMRMNW